jgi:hypothetical protein
VVNWVGCHSRPTSSTRQSGTRPSSSTELVQALVFTETDRGDMVAGVPAGAGELGAILEERPMRMRIISAGIVLGLGIVGITLAQQSGEQPKERRTDRAKLRVQVAKLRAEVEVLQLEHDADSDFLKKLMIDMKNFDTMEAAKGPMKEQVEALKASMGGQMLGAPGALPIPQDEFNKMFSADEATAKVARPVLERLKKEFVQKATELNEKRLELVDVEKRYSEAK